MRVDLIGIGMNGFSSLTAEAADAITKAEVLIGARRMLETVPDDGRERFLAYDAKEIAAFLDKSKAVHAVVLLSGDVGFFSGAKRLTDALSGHAVRLVPGISSVVYFCAKMAISWENMKFVSLHGTKQNIAVHVRSNERTFFLLGGDMTVPAVCRRLSEYGLGNIRVYAGERLGYPEERIFSGSACELQNCETDYLSVMIAENSGFCNYLPTCIPDAEFIRGSVPMTKAQVRGITVSSLHIAKNAVCWDIGCGTGSVSVEMALRCPDRCVYAVDKSEEAVTLTLKNARKFACDNISVRRGTAPEILADLPDPDCVFIGGSGGELNAIFDVISQKNPNACIAVNAVTLETLEAARNAFFIRNCNYSITQIAVTETKQVGEYTMLQAQNPVFLLEGALR